MKKVIGIDLGTGNSCVAVMEGGKPTVIVNDEGQRTTPSIVAFTDNGERKIGAPAKRQAITNPKNTVSFIKRFMGEKYDNVKFDVDRATYEVKKDENGNPRIIIGNKTFSPEEISAFILQKMKATAESYLGVEVSDAVITCPAYYDNAAREAVKAAGKIAGLNVLRIINEPTAAALAYGIDKKKDSEKIVVYDFGSGTLDISVLDLSDGVLEVLSTNGDTHLGGEDFDAVLVNYFVEQFKKDNGTTVDLTKDPMAMQRLKEAAEKAKIELSSQSSTEINLPYITAVEGQPKHLVLTLNRAKFESLADDIFKKAIIPAEDALKKANVTKKDIDEVILVGGSTRIPKVQELVKEFFGKEPNKSVNPDEAVAIGASIQGSILMGDNSDILLLDVTPLNLGIETMGNVATTLIEANTTIPAKKSQIFSTAVDNQPGVEINVLQGNRPMAKDNKQIGIFHLDGIAPAPRGIPQIEVTFDIDANGILNVSAVDKATGKEQHITIEAKSSVSDADIERMKKEAEEFAEADKKAKETADKINEADAFVFQIEKVMSDAGDKVTEEDKESVKPDIESLKKAISDKDIDAIETAKKELESKWYSIAAKLYASGTDNPLNGAFGGPFSGGTGQ